MSTTTVTQESERPPSALVNALLGAVVGVVFGFVPLSTVVGGGVAGYLQGTDRRAGLRVGAIAGVFMAIPFVLVVVLGFGFFAVVTVSPRDGSQGLPIGALVVLLGVVLLASIYTVGGAALGGYLGAYLKEYREDR